MQVLAGFWLSVVLMRAVDWQCQPASPPPSRRGNPCPSGVLNACVSSALSPIGRLFALAAFFEGLTWAGLLVGMFLKYGLQSSELVVWVFGRLHGAAFLFYVAVSVIAALRLRWPW